MAHPSSLRLGFPKCKSVHNVPCDYLLPSTSPYLSPTESSWSTPALTQCHVSHTHTHTHTHTHSERETASNIICVHRHIHIHMQTHTYRDNYDQLHHPLSLSASQFSRIQFSRNMDLPLDHWTSASESLLTLSSV
jgi:HD-like signal output (HDOD) protein